MTGGWVHVATKTFFFLIVIFIIMIVVQRRRCRQRRTGRIERGERGATDIDQVDAKQKRAVADDERANALEGGRPRRA